MNRPWLLWLSFVLCLAVVLSAMGWTTLTVLRFEDNSRRQAAREENVRLALWRMDSSVAPLIAQEAAMPYFAYGAFYPAQRSFADMFTVGNNETVLPSPLLTRGSPHALLYFQFDPNGELSSPQVPAKGKMALAQQACATTEKVVESATRMMQFQALITREQLLERLPAESEPEKTSLTFSNPNLPVPPANAQIQNPVTVVPAQNVATKDNAQVQPPPPQDAQAPEKQFQKLQQKELSQEDNANNEQSAQKNRRSKSSAEWEQRERINKEASQGYNTAYQISVNNSIPQNFLNGAVIANGVPPLQSAQPNYVFAANGAQFGNGGGQNVSQGMLMPVWLGNSLIFARRVTVAGKMYVQGCWVDWKWLNERLLSDVRDLLPDATLEALSGNESERATNRLAALPVKLNPGETILLDPPDGLSPVRISLVIAWLCALLAVGAVAMLLFGTVQLSERRGAFVSAVTHELRTPLTTFRMYAEMLAGGMVPEKAAQQSYLNTLSAEAGRLSHLVENVLSYARLERGSARSQVERVSAERLVGKILPRLNERAAQAGMMLDTAIPEDVAGLELTTDVTAVEQILFNLVDNACKYAANGFDKFISLSAASRNGKLIIRVRDHGPGFSAPELKRLFKPFSKSARQAAISAPGVGLGLALSRRLARDLKGDLALCADEKSGACFELMLPVE